MELFLFMVAMILLTIFIFSFMLPTPLEEDEEEVWDSTEVRLESLLQGVMDPRPEIRERYQNRILAMGPNIIPRLVAALSQELFLSQNQIRLLRIQELLYDFGLRVTPVLLDLLEEEGEDPLIAEGVIELLRKMGSSSLEIVLERFKPRLLPHLAPLLRDWGAPALKAVMENLAQQPQEAVWPRLTLYFGDLAVEPLSTAVHDWRGESRVQAVKIFSQLAPVEHKALFEELLEDVNPDIRAESAGALGRIGGAGVVESLLPLLDDEVAAVRYKVIPALAMLGEPESIPLLARRLQDTPWEAPHFQENLLLSIALTELGEPVDRHLLQEALGLHRKPLRFLALELIKYLPPDERLIYIERLLWDPDWDMVQRAFDEIVDLRSPESVSVLLECADGCSARDPRFERIELSLCSLGDIVSPLLLQRLTREDRSLSRAVRAMSIRVLLQGADIRALKGCLELLQSVDDPELEWDVQPEDLFLYLQRLCEANEEQLTAQLKNFMDEHPDSSLFPVLEGFLSNMPQQNLSQTSLALDAKTPKA